MICPKSLGSIYHKLLTLTNSELGFYVISLMAEVKINDIRIFLVAKILLLRYLKESAHDLYVFFKS
jgi:hypothetical protein